MQKILKDISKKLKVLKISTVRIKMFYCNLYSFCFSAVSESIGVCVLVERICIWGFLVSDLKLTECVVNIRGRADDF